MGLVTLGVCLYACLSDLFGAVLVGVEIVHVVIDVTVHVVVDVTVHVVVDTARVVVDDIVASLLDGVDRLDGLEKLVEWLKRPVDGLDGLGRPVDGLERVVDGLDGLARLVDGLVEGVIGVVGLEARGRYAILPALDHTFRPPLVVRRSESRGGGRDHRGRPRARARGAPSVGWVIRRNLKVQGGWLLGRVSRWLSTSSTRRWVDRSGRESTGREKRGRDRKSTRRVTSGDMRGSTRGSMRGSTRGSTSGSTSESTRGRGGGRSWLNPTRRMLGL